MLKNMDDTNTQEIAEMLHKTIKSFEHFLPAQAPIKDFVHHNTLHGFQHLKFEQALINANNINGANGFIDESRFREFYQQGRITEKDIDLVLSENDELDVNKVIYSSQGVQITVANIVKKLLTHSFDPISVSQLNWQSEEIDALCSFDNKVSDINKKQLLKLFQAHLSSDNNSTKTTSSFR